MPLLIRPHSQYDNIGRSLRRADAAAGLRRKFVSVLDPKYAEGFAFALEVTRESQCSRQQRLDPRTALAERGPPGGAPRTGQRAAARFASYSARLMGSVIEGEDVVQDTLARAFVALQDLEEAPPLRPSCSARSTCYAAARCAWLKNRATPTRTLSTQPSPTPGDVDAQGRGQNRGVPLCGAPHPPTQCRHPEAPVAVRGRGLRLSAAEVRDRSTPSGRIANQRRVG